MSQWIVLLDKGANKVSFGPFDSDWLAQKFAAFLIDQLGQARVMELRSPLAETLTFWSWSKEERESGTSVARPPLWPPKIGDVWEGRSGERWICTGVPSRTAPYLTSIASGADDTAEEIWRRYGPMTRVTLIPPHKSEECPF